VQCAYLSLLYWRDGSDCQKDVGCLSVMYTVQVLTTFAAAADTKTAPLPVCVYLLCRCIVSGQVAWRIGRCRHCIVLTYGKSNPTWRGHIDIDDNVNIAR